MGYRGGKGLYAVGWDLDPRLRESVEISETEHKLFLLKAEVALDFRTLWRETVVNLQHKSNEEID